MLCSTLLRHLDTRRKIRQKFLSLHFDANKGNTYCGVSEGDNIREKTKSRVWTGDAEEGVDCHYNYSGIRTLSHGTKELVQLN